MVKASDNTFPRLQLSTGVATTAPTGGLWELRARADGIYAVSSNTGSAGTGPLGTGSAAAQVAHGARIKRASGNVSVGNNVLTVITFDAEDYDTDTMHDNSTNTSRVVIPSISGVTTGLWTIKASGYTNATTRLDASFRVNAAGNPASGTAIFFASYYANNSVNGFVAATDHVFTAGDYVELFVRSTGATAVVTFDSGISPLMTVSFLGKVT